MSDPKITDAFLTAGRFGLSSILIGLRNWLQLYHDHSEAGGTPISGSVASIASGAILTRHIPDLSLLSRKISPTFVQNIAVATLAVAVGASETVDTPLEISVNEAVNTKAYILYSAAIDPGINEDFDILFRVTATDSPRFLHMMGPVTSSEDNTFIHSDIVDVPSGAQTLRAVWRQAAGSKAMTVPFPRRFAAFLFTV